MQPAVLTTCAYGAPVLAFEWPDWSLPEWFSVIGFPAGILALVLAWYQLREAKRQSKHAAEAADAARSAIERTERRLSDIQLLSLLHQLQELRRDLDLAVSNGRRQETIRYLGDWVKVASEAQAILHHGELAGGGMLESDLARSIQATGDAKDDIIDRKENIETATREVRGLVTDICASGMRIVGDMKAFVRSEIEDGHE